MPKLIYALTFCVGVIYSCKNAENDRTGHHTKTVIACEPGNSKLDTALIENTSGMKGVLKNGEYKIFCAAK